MSDHHSADPYSAKTKLEAAFAYRNKWDWAVHALHGPSELSVDEAMRGKAPVRKGWRKWTKADVTDAYIHSNFGNGHDYNLGIVVRGEHVCVDLDSKEDAGASVRKWLDTQPHLKGPRERTRGGAHLHFLCSDLPVFRKKNGKPYDSRLVADLNDSVKAELFFDGLNLVVSPSIHPKGGQYEWELTGEFPRITWAQLQEWFGFVPPQDVPQNEDGAWWRRFKGDLTTLDICALFRQANRLGEVADVKEGKVIVECPWRTEHSDKGPWKQRDKDAVIWTASDSFPSFHCFHAHCAGRSLQQVLEWFEETEPGLVDQHCARQRVYEPGQLSPDGRPRILLPRPGRPDGIFADEVGRVMAAKREWFRKSDFLVEIRKTHFNEQLATFEFHHLRPVEACTAIERFIEFGNLAKDRETFVPVSMGSEKANILINSPQFHQQLPLIVRVLHVRIPMMYSEKAVLPELGYDERFQTFTDPSGPEIQTMEVLTARKWIEELLSDFPFENEQSRTHGFARLITPMCRGLIGWGAKTPFWLFEANRERLGKDYLAGLTGILYDGYANEDAPIEPKDSKETKKRITSALKAGRGRIHFANCRGYIQDTALEQAITAKFWTDRILGGNTEITMPCELEISMSANVGLSYTGDLAHRCRRISLFYEGENPNERRFTKSDLHRWATQHRSELLSALMTYVDQWLRDGAPVGKTRFASFPRWAEVVGGITQHAGFGDPCLPDQTELHIGGDEDTQHMKALYVMAREKWGDCRIEIKHIVEFLVNDAEASLLFSWLKLSERSGQTALGKMLRRFRGRILGGIVLLMSDLDKRRAKFWFELRQDPGSHGPPADGTAKEAAPPCLNAESKGTGGNIGNIGNIFNPVTETNSSKFDRKSESKGEKAGANGVTEVANVDNVAKPAQSADLPGIATAVLRAGRAVLMPESATRISLAAGDELWALNLRALRYNLGPLASALEAAKVVGHGLKPVAVLLKRKCDCMLKNVFCTETAARLLVAGTDEAVDLESCLRRYSVDSADAVERMCALKDALTAKLTEVDLSGSMGREMELLPVIVNMEARGIAVDRELLKSLDIGFSESAADTKDAMQTEATFNPNASKEVLEVLNSRGNHLQDTTKETLAACQDPLAGQMIDYRSSNVPAGHARSLLKCVAADGRVHANFDAIGAVTGRFTTSNPNLHGICRSLRVCFAAPAGRSLVVADYNQIELRIAAFIAKEEVMLEAFRKGADFHRVTASLLLNKSPDLITAEERRLAKAINFGMLYGGTASGLVASGKQYGLKLAPGHAQAYRDRFFGIYPAFQRWHENARKDARVAPEVRTCTKRRRLLPERTSDWNRFTALINMPVQGGAADAMKIAMLRVHQRLPADANMVSTIHDELIVETPEAVAGEARQIVKECMLEAMAELFPGLPVEVEAKVCQNWGEK